MNILNEELTLKLWQFMLFSCIGNFLGQILYGFIMGIIEGLKWINDNKLWKNKKYDIRGNGGVFKKIYKLQFL